MNSAFLAAVAAIALLHGQLRMAGQRHVPMERGPATVLATENPLPQAESGVVSGTVLDPSGSALVGAKVVLTLTDGRLYKQALTDAAGAFRIGNVAPGHYMVDVQALGFQELKRDVVIGKKTPGPMRLSLAIATEKLVVNVSADQAAPVVSTEVSENQSANTIERSSLDRLPIFDQDYITTLSRFLDDNAIGTNGVTLVVNGVEANGPGVTSSAIQEVKINQNPYSALFSRPGRARLEIITKGGTTDFHGTVNVMFRDAVFDATNKFAITKPPERRQFYEGSISGPFGSGKKTTFLLSLDQDMDDQEAVVNATGVGGSPINENVAAPMHHFFGSGRVFHDFSNGDQFWIGYSYERQTNANQNVGGLVLADTGYNQKMQEHEINVSYRHQFSPKLVNQLRFLVGHFDRPTTSTHGGAQIVVSGAFTGGGAQVDGKRTEYHFDGTDVLSYSTGKHTINMGIDVPDISRRGEDDFTNREGTYTFGSLAAYKAGQPSTYLLQTGEGHLVFLEKVLSGFVEDNIRLKPNFSVSVGLRYYWQNYFHDDANNFAPRFGFAYAPSKNSKTVIRGGAGVFFDRSGPRPIADLLHFDGVHLLRFIVNNPSYPVTQPELAAVPTSVVTLDPRAHIPYTVQYSAGVERQITAKSTLSATYIRSRGIDIFRSIDANAPLPPTYSARPNPNLGQDRELQSDGYQKGNALEVTFRGSPVKFLTGQVQYTFSKTSNNTSGVTFFPANSYDPSADWALSDNDRRHKFDLLGTAQAGKMFVLGMALSVYSGKPVNVTTGIDNNHDGVINDRPAGVGRNTLPGPGLINLDLSVARDFLLSKSPEHTKMFTISMNSFNVLNHGNDVTYVGVFGSPRFGSAVAAQPPRRLQFDAQFKF